MNEHYFGGGLTETLLHPIVLVAMLAAIAMLWFLPRKYMLAPFLVVALLTPESQQVNLGGLHIFVLRILILAAWFRIIISRFTSGRPLYKHGLNRIDKVLLAWALVRGLAFVLLWRDQQAVVNQIGILWTVVGGYFLVRYLIRDKEDIGFAIKTLALVAMTVGAAMLNEHLRLQNVFGMLGGVRLTPEIRDGHIRAQGPFAHALLAGSFGATLVPLFIWLWDTGKARMLSVLGILASTAMSLLSACSTPLMAYAAGVFALALFPLRKRLSIIRWSFVGLLVALHLVMKAPVWFLIARIDLAGGSSGYHRAMLIDTFLRHFGDWWLLGTKDAFSWGWDMWDTCNQFIQEGEAGGLFALGLFIALLYLCFSRIGKATKSAQSGDKWAVWTIGAALFSNVVAYFGISYFDQTQIAWFVLLAIISAVPVTVMSSSAVRNQTLVVEEPLLDKEEANNVPVGAGAPIWSR